LAILVTGPDTTLGSYLIRELVASGFAVRVLATPDHPVDIESVMVQTSSSATLDLESCITAVEGSTAVFHCESERLLGDPRNMQAARAHLEATRNLLVAMARGGVEDFIYASSALLFRPGTLEEPGDESAPWPAGEIPCLEALRSAADLIARYGDDGKLRPVVLCPTLLIGADAAAGSQGRWFLQNPAAVAGLGGGVNVAGAADAAAAAAKALGRGKPGEAFILGGENLTCSALAEALCSRGPSEETTRKRRRNSRRARQAEPLMALLAGSGLYYSPARAVERLELNITPARQVAAEQVERGDLAERPGCEKSH
jgi:dihydroflavonol-4-reductase